MANTIDGHFVWYELMTTDAKAAISFYGEVCGWKTQPFGDEGFQMWVGSQGPLGGVSALTPEMLAAKVPPHWMGSVQVADVDAIAAQAGRLGGKVLAQPLDIPTVGRYAVVADPQGAAFALFKAGFAMERHDASKDGEQCWAELMTNDSAGALGFYSELLGWTLLEEMDTGPSAKYRIFGAGAERLGGMMTMPKQAPPMPPLWAFYTSVSDLDAALARATARGAQVVHGPADIPGGARIAMLLDPQGATFALHQAAPSAAVHTPT